MSAEDRPNYFVLLELDPNAPWDEQVYRRALSQARTRWAAATGGLQSRQETGDAKRYLALFGDIVAVMGDPSRREKERAEALQLRAAALVIRRKDLQDRLTLMLMRGYLLEQEATRLREEFKDVLAEDQDLADRLDQAEVRFPPVDDSGSRLSPSTEAQLRDWLAQVKASSIYDVLRYVDDKVTNSSPLDVLIAAADALYREAHLRTDKSDPSIKARERLSGLAKTIFESADQRDRLDVSMKVAKVQSLLERFERMLSVARSVTAAQFEWFLEQARTDGADDLDFARDRFIAYFSNRGWTIEVLSDRAESALRRKVQCPRCAQLNEPKQKACVTCGLLLLEPCPNCGKKAPRYGGGCSCGFPIGQRDLVEDLIVQASEALDAHELAQAEALLGRAARIWDLPRNSTDPIKVKIQKMESALATAQEKTQSVQATIQQLLSNRHYVALAKVLRTAPEILAGGAVLLTRAEEAINNATELCRTAKLPGTPRARQAELYLQAMQICPDLELARVELARIPPEPPGGVRATISDPTAGVLVSWEESAEPDVSYVVVRGTGQAPPATVEDLPGQQRLGTVQDTTFRDRDIAELAGTPLTYAVFTERAGTFSAASAAAPVAIMAESVLEVRNDDAKVVLTWRSPPRTAQIEVSRQESDGSASPVVLDVPEPGRLVDTDVQVGARYIYTVRTAYPDPAGGLRWSAGTSAEIIPAKRPAPPGRLTVVGSRPEYGFYEYKVHIRSPVPERGVVQVVRQVGVGSLREGDQSPESTFRPDGQVLEESPPVTDYWLEREQALRSYVPVLMLDGMAYVGAARHYARAAEIDDLQGEFVGGAVRIGWNWPEGCGEVLVGYDPTRQLEDPTTAGRQMKVGRVGGERAGGCDIPVGQDSTTLNVVVAAVVKETDVDFVTSGVRQRISRPASHVRYEVRPAGRHRRELVLQAAKPVELPAMLLQERPDRSPHTRDDGDRVCDFPPRRLTGRLALPLPRSDQSALIYRLFTASTVGAAAVELLPA